MQFDASKKIFLLKEMLCWRASLRQIGARLVVTNGCFDLLHIGHIRCLEKARNLGDRLLVGLNGDPSVRALKGAGRPIHPEADRALVLAALGCVDAVCIFHEKRAHRFLAQAQPDIYVKGGDYTIETLDPIERENIERHGGKIMILPSVLERSTTAIIERMREGLS